EGGGVAAGFGGEVAAEAEHVGPFGEPELCELLHGTQAEAFGDEPPGMPGHRKRVDALGGSDAPVEGADAFGSLGCVLGDVAGYGLVGQLSGAGDGAYVELGTPGERPRG